MTSDLFSDNFLRYQRMISDRMRCITSRLRHFWQKPMSRQYDVILFKNPIFFSDDNLLDDGLQSVPCSASSTVNKIVRFFSTKNIKNFIENLVTENNVKDFSQPSGSKKDPTTYFYAPRVEPQCRSRMFLAKVI